MQLKKESLFFSDWKVPLTNTELTNVIIHFRTENAHLLKYSFLLVIIVFLPKLYFCKSYESALRFFFQKSTSLIYGFLQDGQNDNDNVVMIVKPIKDTKKVNLQAQQSLKNFFYYIQTRIKLVPKIIPTLFHSLILGSIPHRWVKSIIAVLKKNAAVIVVAMFIFLKAFVWSMWVRADYKYVRYNQKVRYREYRPAGTNSKDCFRGLSYRTVYEDLHWSLLRCTDFKDHGSSVSARKTGYVVSVDSPVQRACVPLTNERSSISMNISTHNSKKIDLSRESLFGPREYTHPIENLVWYCEVTGRNCSNNILAKTNSASETVMHFFDFNRTAKFEMNSFHRPGNTVLTEVLHLARQRKVNVKEIAKKALAINMNMHLSSCFKEGKIVENENAKELHLSINCALILFLLCMEYAFAKAFINRNEESKSEDKSKDTMDGKLSEGIQELAESVV